MCNGPHEYSHDETPQDAGVNGTSRRGLLTGLGAGVGLALTGLPALASSAHAAVSGDSAGMGEAGTTDVGTLSYNGAWCNPAQGRFPNGGHFGAPRGGASHAGQDISNPVGTALYAAAAGTVIRRGVNVLPGRTGNGIVIRHASGHHTYYGHMQSFAVGLNATVSVGQRIGNMGATGNVTGPHLHFETHSGSLGNAVNPVPFCATRGVNLRGGWPYINPGAAGARVRSIQSLLNQRGAGLVVDGDFGSLTNTAVRNFQSSQGLVVDGQVGPLTWPRLVYTLRQGANGHHVRGLQAALNMRSAGLVVDGDFGSVTNTAVRTFQNVNQLVVDGEAGPLTWTAIVN